MSEPPSHALSPESVAKIWPGAGALTATVMRLCVLAVIVITLPASRATEPAVMRYIHNAPSSLNGPTRPYVWEVLAAALERTRAEEGDYVLERGPRMSKTRRVDELRRATGVLTVIYHDASVELERELIPIRIPIDRNLLGYRLLVLRRERLPELAGVERREDLVRFSLGMHFDWIDVPILREAGFRVMAGSDYDGIFDMVDNGRFDLLPRAASTVLDELVERQKRLPDLVIEPRLALHYPMPLYLWFPKTDEGRRLAARAERGLRAMIADGSFERMFHEAFDPLIDQLGLQRRRIIRIRNPYLPADTPLDDPRLWYDPERMGVEPTR